MNRLLFCMNKKRYLLKSSNISDQYLSNQSTAKFGVFVLKLIVGLPTSHNPRTRKLVSAIFLVIPLHIDSVLNGKRLSLSYTRHFTVHLEVSQSLSENWSLLWPTAVTKNQLFIAHHSAMSYSPVNFIYHTIIRRALSVSGNRIGNGAAM